uniref:Uncharacterized protein n=1 Tax=Hyaloperonospora arabidopsidis (strain Emoy2) TaxID=559515 RepID=M4BYL1_HYAAE
MLDENAKKESYWKTKLASLHAAFITEQEQNAGVFEDDADFPARKRQKGSKSADREDASEEKMEEEDEDKDSDEEEDVRAVGRSSMKRELNHASVVRYEATAESHQC